MFHLSSPKRAEIDIHTSRLIVGVIALSLASLTNLFSQIPLTSISESYHQGGWSRDIFVGFLFAISAFLLAYNGITKPQMVLSKVAAFAAIGVAIFPCYCGGYPQIIPYVHGISAAVMFLILAFFCYTFFQQARDKPSPQAKFRSFIYAASGITIIVSILILALDNLLDGAISSKISRLTFYGEGASLIAFGIAWLTASRILPLLTGQGERLSLFGD
jgi:hypothetical protein